MDERKIDPAHESSTSRRVRRRPSVAPREWAVLVFSSLAAAYLSWGLGGIPTASLHLIFWLCLIPLVVALVPLPSVLNGRDGEHGNLRNWLRLIAFPGFWLGLLFLAYISIQNLNTNLVQVREGTTWWIEYKAVPVAWLPTGLEAEYDPMNGWRVLVGFVAAFSLLCAVWVGLRRRQSLVLFLWAFVVSGTAMAVTAMLMKLTEADAVLWRFPSANLNFWGSFFYRNQGTAFLNLILVAACFLFFYHARRTERLMRGSGPHLLAFCFAALIFASVAMAVSRGGFLFGSIIAFGFLALIVLRFMSNRAARGNLLVSLIVLVVLGGGVWSSTRYIDWEALQERFDRIDVQDIDRDARYLSTQATMDMAREQLWMGWGAGSFRYLFPRFQQAYPELFYTRYHRQRGWEGRRFYRYAHNDLAQSLAEYGIIGCSLLSLSLLYWIFMLLGRSRGYRIAGLMVVLGIFAATGHAVLDFIFQSPSYLVAFCALLVGAARLLDLEHQRNRRELDSD